MPVNLPRLLRWSAPVAAMLAAALLAWSPPAHARVTRIVVDTTTDISGQPGYEALAGRAFGELDPADPKNALITDIELVSGKVEYVAKFLIRKPKDMSQTSGLLWHDVPNRGGNVGFTDDLFAGGDVHLLSGWQGDNAGTTPGSATIVPANATCVPPYAAPCAAPVSSNYWVKVPVLTGVTGQILGRIVNRGGMGAQPLNVMGNPIPYFPADPTNNADATLTTHLKETVTGVVTEGATIPNTDWVFCGGGTFAAPTPVTTLPARLCLKDGFDATKLYQLVYTAKDPYVLGVGTAAFRDVASFFRYAAKDDFDTSNPLANPLAGPSDPATYIKWAIIRGSSQSGNFTRHFIHLGMNQDEAGRIVHEGAWPLIAGRRVANNSRWGQPDGVLELYQMGSEGPQWWTTFADQGRGLPPGGILDRCKKTDTCPKVIETFGGAEVYALKMTPSWVGTGANTDIKLPQNVRRYYLPSSTHGGGNGDTTENPAAAGSVNCPGNNWGKGTLRANPVPATGLVNRMRVALRDWVMLGDAPARERLAQALERNARRCEQDREAVPDGSSRNTGLHLHAGKLRIPHPRLRLGPGIRSQRRVGHSHEHPAGDRGRDEGHGAARGRGRKRPRRRAHRAARCAAGHVSRLEHHRRRRRPGL